MAWDELDIEGAIWRIGSGRTRNSRPRDVLLAASAMRALLARERREGRDLVFGRSGPFSGWSKAKAALDKRVAEAIGAPLPPWILHDIRRTVATRLADLGVLPHVIEAILNHSSGHKAGFAGIYNRSTYAAEKREALRTWSDFVFKVPGDR
jgi:integrase